MPIQILRIMLLRLLRKVIPVTRCSMISHNAGKWAITVGFCRIIALILIGGTIRVTFVSGLLTTKMSIRSRNERFHHEDMALL